MLPATRLSQTLAPSSPDPRISRSPTWHSARPQPRFAPRAAPLTAMLDALELRFVNASGCAWAAWSCCTLVCCVQVYAAFFAQASFGLRLGFAPASRSASCTCAPPSRLPAPRVCGPHAPHRSPPLSPPHFALAASPCYATSPRLRLVCAAFGCRPAGCGDDSGAYALLPPPCVLDSGLVNVEIEPDLDELIVSLGVG